MSMPMSVGPRPVLVQSFVAPAAAPTASGKTTAPAQRTEASPKPAEANTNGVGGGVLMVIVGLLRKAFGK